MTWAFNVTQFWIILTRLSGMLLMIPAISQVPIPPILRITVVIWLGLALLPTLPPLPLEFSDVTGFAIGLGFEFLLGMGIGFVIRLVFAVIEIGGTMLDSELGFRAAAQMNPGSAISGGPIARMLVITSLLYFWILDYFSVMILALRESFLLIAKTGKIKNRIMI